MCLNAVNVTTAVNSSLPHPRRAGMFAGSRRARLWELPEQFHCPVVGVCLSPKTLQKLVRRLAGTSAPDNDYECHSLAVNACRQRGRLSELLQKELDTRHRLAVAQCRRLDTPAALLAAWQTATRRGDIAGCFWALMTHPKTDGAVRELIYRDVHMIQHQAGASIRVDLQAFEALGRENATLLREMGRIQRRMSDFAQEKTTQIDKLTAELLRRDQERVCLHTRLAELEAENRQLARSSGLVQQNLELQAAVERLRRKLHLQADALARLRMTVAHGKAACPDAVVPQEIPMRPAAELSSLPAGRTQCAPRLEHKTVFVVGGRQGSFNEYRSTIEQSGAHFLYHDGGLENSMQTLESGLQAADYVICQTGCISHASYWKVKDFCKRTGKRCVFLDSPGVSALRQSIDRLTALA